MSSTPQPVDRPNWAALFIPTVIAAVAYLATPFLLAGGSPRPITHFQQLASAFVHGRLGIEISSTDNQRPHAQEELIPSDQPGRYYCAYPPLPAVLLMPWAAFGTTAVAVARVCRLISILNVWLFAACLGRLTHRLDQPAASTGARIVLTLLFGLGTVCWHNAKMGGDWHLAHAVALAAILFALREYLAAERPFVVGCFVALAVLTRPTAALTIVFFALALAGRRHALARLVAAPALAVLLLAAYNQARFGSPGDFGYNRMLLQGAGRDLMERFGQFHPHFILPNAFWYFLAPPWPLADGRFPFLGFDPRGLGLFFASPALLYAVVALRTWRSKPLVRHATLGIVACLIPLLLYFNTGFVQFGHRFSMDYLPLLMILAVAGMGSRPTHLACAAIIVSMVIQAAGVFLLPISPLPTWLAPGP